MEILTVTLLIIIVGLLAYILKPKKSKLPKRTEEEQVQDHEAEQLMKDLKATMGYNLTAALERKNR